MSSLDVTTVEPGSFIKPALRRANSISYAKRVSWVDNVEIVDEWTAATDKPTTASTGRGLVFAGTPSRATEQSDDVSGVGPAQYAWEKQSGLNHNNNSVVARPVVLPRDSSDDSENSDDEQDQADRGFYHDSSNTDNNNKSNKPRASILVPLDPLPACCPLCPKKRSRRHKRPRSDPASSNENVTHSKSRPPSRFVCMTARLLLLAILFTATVVSCLASTRRIIFDEIHDNHHAWTNTTKSWISSSVYAGFSLGSPAGGLLVAKVGSRLTLAASSLLVGAFTLLTPVASVSLIGVITVRVLLGFAQGWWLPSLFHYTMQWAPTIEITSTICLLVSSTQIAYIIAIYASPLIGEAFGWSWEFYIFGGIAMAFSGLILLFVTARPEDHSLLSKAEIVYIVNNRTVSSPAGQIGFMDVPWREIIFSAPFLAALITQFCHTLCVSLIVLRFRELFAEHFDVDWYSLGYKRYLPHIVGAVSVIVGGIFADILIAWQLMRTTSVRKLLNTVGMIMSAVFLALLGKPVLSVDEGLVFVTLGVGMSFFAIAGFLVIFQDMSNDFSAHMVGLSLLLAATPGIFAASLTAFLLDTGNWTIIFVIAAAAQGIGALVFLFFGYADSKINMKQFLYKPLASTDIGT